MGNCTPRVGFSAEIFGELVEGSASLEFLDIGFEHSQLFVCCEKIGRQLGGLQWCQTEQPQVGQQAPQGFPKLIDDIK